MSEINKGLDILIPVGNNLICNYWEDDKVHSIYISLKQDECLGVEFDKGYVIVKTQYEVKFCCKGSLFISLWKSN